MKPHTTHAHKAEVLAAARKSLKANKGAVKTLRNRLDSTIREHEQFRHMLTHPLAGVALEECRDAIVEELLCELLKTAKIIAREIPENGDYILGVHIPNRYFQQHVKRVEPYRLVGRDAHVPAFESVKTINVRLFEHKDKERLNDG